MYHPDLNKKFILRTDASGFAISAILAQEDIKGDKIPIMFGPRILKGPEIRYTTTERGLLAIIYGLEEFITFLYRNKIEIYTDHNALTFLKSCRFLNDRLARWSFAIQDFDKEIKFCKGKDNIAADVLSRYDNLNNDEIKFPIIAATVLAREPSEQVIDRFGNVGDEHRNDQSLLGILENMDENEENFESIREYYRKCQEMGKFAYQQHY